MTNTPTRRILPAEATGRPPQVQAMLECWHRMKCWMGQLNAGRKMPAEKYGYIHRKMEIEADQLRLHLLHPEISTASPNAGKVTEEDVEIAAKAIWDRVNEDGTDTEWDELTDLNKEQGRNLARAALSALGLEVEG